jgi:hypothetical protein
MIHSLLKTVALLQIILFLISGCQFPNSEAEIENKSQPAEILQSSANMPADLMTAFLAALAQPFENRGQGYHTRSGGLDFDLQFGGIRSGNDWELTLNAIGRGLQFQPVAQVEPIQTEKGVEYWRGHLTEWYRNTAMGVEQGFTIQERPAGTGLLALNLDYSQGMEAIVDDNGLGMSFALSEGRTLRYDQLRAWDADGNPLKSNMRVVEKKVILDVDDQVVVYPITIDLLIYLEQKVVEPSDGYEIFGSSTALSADGRIALVGAPSDTVSTNHYQGSVYVFERNSQGDWEMIQKVLASDGKSEDYFGTSLALSADGNTAIIGASGDDNGTILNQGSAYILTRDTSGMWNERQKLLAFDGESRDIFGSEVALSADGDTVIIGVFADAITGIERQGSAYIFVRNPDESWSEQQKLTASDGDQEDWFGVSVALSGDGNTALIGAQRFGSGSFNGPGAAYIFTRIETTWSEKNKLIPLDGESGDSFGFSVALSGDGRTALIGAPDKYSPIGYSQGAAYVFVKEDMIWNQQQKLMVSYELEDLWFGLRLTLSSDGLTALIGAPFEKIGVNSKQGSAYIFTFSEGAWTEREKLIASDGMEDDIFAYSSLAVSADGGIVLIGAPEDDIDAEDQGSAYFFIREGEEWSESQKSTSFGGDGYEDYKFGVSVAISTDGTTALVKSDSDYLEEEYGSVYLFSNSPQGWQFRQKLPYSNCDSRVSFGNSVALSADGGIALVSACAETINGNYQQGAAYLFVRNSSGEWIEQQKLLASDGIANDRFGWSVALSANGDQVVISSAGQDENGDISFAVYIYLLNIQGIWEQTQRIPIIKLNGVAFGSLVAVSADGGTILVGDPDKTSNMNHGGSVYVYVRESTGEWVKQQRLIAPDSIEEDIFGMSIALSGDGDTVLVGSNNFNHFLGYDHNFAYVFIRNNSGVWNLEQKLTAEDDSHGYFGISVALSLDGNIALVGATAYHDAAYLFTRNDSNWTQLKKIVPLDNDGDDGFGYSVALSGDGQTYLIGSPLDSVAGIQYTGSAYFYFNDLVPTVASISHIDSNPTNAVSVNYTVTFSEDVSGVDETDFAVFTTGSISGAAIVDLSGAENTYTVTVSTGTGEGTIRLDIPDTAVIKDSTENALVGLPYTAGDVYIIDRTAPQVSSILRVNSDPTNAVTLDYTVTFSEPVSDVDVYDFTLSTTGTLDSASISNVSGSGAVYSVTIVAGTGEGTLRLDIPSLVTVSDLAGNTLTEIPYTDGETYNVDWIVPQIISIFRIDPISIETSKLRFTVTFSESVTGVDIADLSLFTSGDIKDAVIMEVNGSMAVYTVTVSTGTGKGTLRLDILETASITDLANNPLGGLPFSSDDTYISAYKVLIPLLLR